LRNISLSGDRLRLSRRATSLAIAAALLTSLGCASGDQAKTLPAESANVERVVAAGYGVIVNRFVDPIENKTVALFALRGLRSLDKEFTVEETPDAKLVIKAGNKEIGVWQAPAGDDARGWTRLTAQALQTSYDGSPVLHGFTQDQIVKAAITGALQPLDKHSRYADPSSASDARFNREGSGGIGIAIRSLDGVVVIASVFPDMPASKAGFKQDDRIVAIEGESVAGWDEHRVVTRLRGDIDTKVNLTVDRPSEGRQISAVITRALIIPPTVVYTRVDDVAVIKLAGFNQASTLRLQRAIEEAQKEIGPGMAGIILDMRGNPGGLLDQAISVSSLFLEDGLITSTKGRHPDSSHVYRTAGAPAASKVPMVILINGKSASAAEIVAAALQDRGRAVVVGSNSYGKATVQSVIRLPNDGELTLTWSRLYAPSGYSWHDIGVMPIVCTADVAGDGDDLSRQFAERSRRMTEVIALWHSSHRPTDQKLAQLRDTCAPTDQQPEKDTKLALRLLHDPQLYARAIGATTSAVAQR
jgi:carboxyl-terminal processing protease